MKHYNIFISHAWKYSKHYKKVTQWLNEAQENGEFTWSNFSEYEEKPLVILNSKTERITLMEEIDKKVAESSAVIVLSGMYTEECEWIGFVVDNGVKNGKYIIGIEPWTQGKVPQKVSSNANVMVGWDKEALIEALKNS